MFITEYKVIKTDFTNLEDVLNSLYINYPRYYLYQILSEHSYDGALAIIILKLNVEDDYDDFK